MRWARMTRPRSPPSGCGALAFVVHDLEAGPASGVRALALNSDLAEAWFWGGWVEVGSASRRRSDRALRSCLEPEPTWSVCGRNAKRDRVCPFLPGPTMTKLCSWASNDIAGQSELTQSLILVIAAASNAMVGRRGRDARRSARTNTVRFPRYVFPISKTCSPLFGGPKTSRDSEEGSPSRPGCPNDRGSGARPFVTR